MTSQTASQFMQTLQHTEETKDVEPLVSLFSEEAELINLAMPESLKGQEGARQFWRKYLSVFDHIHSTFTNVVENNGSAVLEWISKGALPTSEDVSYRGVSILEIQNGKVHRFRTYYDSAVFLPQGAKKG